MNYLSTRGTVPIALLLFCPMLCCASTAWVTVCCNNPGVVSLYNSKTGKALPWFGSGGANPNDAILSPDSSTLYVANLGPNVQGDLISGQVTNIDTASGTIIRTLSFSDSPSALALSSDGSRLFVASVQQGFGIVVHLVDVSSGTILASSGNYASNSTARLVLAHDGSAVYLAVPSGVYALDSTSLAQTHQLNISVVPLNAAISPDDTELFVPTRVHQIPSVTAINTATFSADWTVKLSTADRAGPLAVDPSGTNLYVAVATSPVTLATVSIPAHVQTNSFSIGNLTPSDLTVSADGQTLYGVAAYGPLFSIELATHAIDQLAVEPGNSNFLSFNAASGLLAVANPDADQIQGIDIATGATVAGIPIGQSKGVGPALRSSPNGRLALSVDTDSLSLVSLSKRDTPFTAYLPDVASAISTPGSNIVYAIAGSYEGATSELFAVDLLTGVAKPEFTLPFPAASSSIAVSSDGATVYASSPDAAETLVIDTSTFQQTGTIALVGDTLATASAQPSLVYIVSGNSYGPQYLSVWSRSTGSVIQTIELFTDLQYLDAQVSSDGSRIYILGYGTITYINAAKGLIQWYNGYDDFNGYLSFAVSPDGKYVTATGQYSSNLYVHDGQTGEVIETYPLIGPGGAVTVTE